MTFFNKEGLFIQFVLMTCFFVVAAILAFWAIRSGQFKDTGDDVRFDVFDKDELAEVVSQKPGAALSA